MVYDSVFNVLLSCRQSLIDDLHTLRCFFFLLLSATFISYHRFKCLSTTFLFIFIVKLSLNNNSYMIPCILSVVNNFFKYFFDFFLSSGENGIRTHAPLRTNGFQDRLVMTTSISLHLYLLSLSLSDERYIIIYYSICQLFFSFFYFFCILRFYLSFDLLSRIASAKIRSSGVVIFIL